MDTSCKTAVAGALAGGYVLGRTRKAKIAFALATYLAGRRFGRTPQALATEGMRRLRENPGVADLREQIQGELMTAVRSAVSASADRRFSSLAQTLRDRGAQGKPPEDEEDREREEGEFDEEELNEEDEGPADEEPEEEEPEEKSAEEEEAPRRRARRPRGGEGGERTARRRAPRKQAADKPAAKKEAPAKGAPAKKSASARKTAAKNKTARGGNRSRSAQRGR